MIIKIDENRKLHISKEGKTQNENDATTLNIIVPEKYIDYIMKISFYTSENEDIGSEVVLNNTYIITNAITQYQKVYFYITLIKDEEIFITETKTLKFISNKIVDGEIPQEEIDIVNSILAAVGEKITEVDALEIEIQTKLDNGDFDGADGVGISSIVFNQDYTMTITLTNGNSYTSQSLRGSQGEKGENGTDGIGILSIVKTGTSGLIDTYTITYTNNTSSTFTITNGQNGANGQDGHTPVKGTDYWTAEDIASIEAYCDSYIDEHITDAIGGEY